MTRQYSCCWQCRSDRVARVALRYLTGAALVLGIGFHGAADAHARSSANGGTVTGSITVERAALRTEGAKHDLDVVVYLEPLGAPAPPPSQGKATMDQKGLVFVPHVLAIQKGTTVTFLNSDNDPHNVYFLNDRTGETLDIGTWGPGVSVDHRFEEPGMVITLCMLHLEMAAYIVVVDGPWFTLTQLDPSTSTGSFAVQGVPPGEYELTAWHKTLEQKGGPVRIAVGPSGTTEVDVVITKPKYASTSK